MLRRCVLCGVGGQGTILAAHVLAQTAIDSGYDVKVSEIHGMSQRGGSVSTVVTFGDEVHSMVCGNADANVIVSFDMLEALRSRPLLKEDGVMISNDAVIKPSSVLTGKMQLPADMRDILLDSGTILVPAESMAYEAGNRKTSNVVMLGAFSAALPFDRTRWIDVIRKHVPERTIDANLLAFDLGRSFAQEHAGDSFS